MTVSVEGPLLMAAQFQKPHADHRPVGYHVYVSGLRVMWLVIRLALIALLLRKIAVDARHVRRNEIASTRLIIPILILAAALLVANHLVPKPVAAVALLAIDFAFLLFCLKLVRAIQYSRSLNEMPERRLERVLLQFFPPMFAKFVSADITVLSHSLAGLKAFVNVVHHTPHTYLRGSKVIIIAVVMGAAIIPDAVFFWLLFPHHLWWFATLLNLLDIWAFLWLLGIYGTMARRPHEISLQKVVLRNGILQSVEFDPKDIKNINIIGIVKRRQLPRKRHDGSTVLTFGGVPLIDIELRRPAVEHHLFFAMPRAVRRVYVATDVPDALTNELSLYASGCPR